MRKGYGAGGTGKGGVVETIRRSLDETSFAITASTGPDVVHVGSVCPPSGRSPPAQRQAALDRHR
jgi:hypothetical protein